jgi:uncharacterized protein (DUF2235 family)
MPRNLVICCDGTNNEFGSQNTNVVRLIQCLNRDPARQMIYYDPGVGTLPEPGWMTWIGKKLSRCWSLAFGAGLTKNVEEAYAYLMDVWEPGDRVFLFGYSRGAYSVRVLSGMLHLLGLLAKDNDNLVPYAMRLFKGIRKTKPEDRKNKYWKVCDEFRETFGRDAGDPKGHFPVHFLGVWDTVSSVGWVWEPKSFPFTQSNPSVKAIRHAVSIDERRAFFRQNLFSQAKGQDLKEHWFAGVHGDIGGGYPAEDGGLWRCAFEWMLGEAEAAGLEIDGRRQAKVLAGTSNQPWVERQHESLTLRWWPAEVFPKTQGAGKGWFRCNRGRSRFIKDGCLIDRTALLRVRAGGYEPPNLTRRFLDETRELPEVPEALPFER